MNRLVIRTMGFAMLTMIAVTGCQTHSSHNLVSSNSSPEQNVTTVKVSRTVTLSDMGVDNIILGDSESKVETRLGQPTSIKHTAMPKVKQADIFQYPFGRVMFDAQTNKAYAIFVDQPTSLKTPTGVGQGSTLYDVEQAYKQYPHSLSYHNHYANYVVFDSDKSAWIGFGFAYNQKSQWKDPKMQKVISTQVVLSRYVSIPENSALN